MSAGSWPQQSPADVDALGTTRRDHPAIELFFDALLRVAVDPLAHRLIGKLAGTNLHVVDQQIGAVLAEELIRSDETPLGTTNPL